MTRFTTLTSLALMLAAGMTAFGSIDSATAEVRDHRGPVHSPRTRPASMPGGVDVRPNPFANSRDGRPRATVRSPPRR
jgi:hypothetical protein